MVNVDNKRGFGLVVGAVLIFFLGLTSSVAGAAEQDSRKTLALEPVKVTAQKQEETAQETPVSITILSESDLEDKMIEGIEDMVDFVPNMATFNAMTLGENVVTMRGITASATTRNTAVGMYVDGVPVLSSFGYTSGLLDVERVEVLRGPQGTLYGKSTQAGVVSVVTAKPTNEFKAKAMATGAKQLSSKTGDQYNGDIGFSLSGPIVEDTLFFNLATKMGHKDGFIKNTTTDEPEYERDNLYGDAKLRWTPTRKLDVTISFSGESLESDGNNANSTLNADRVVASDLRSYQDTDIDTQAMHIGYAFNDNLKLTSISSRRSTKIDANLDLDFSAAYAAHGKTDSKKVAYAQELRLNGEYGDWDWLAGVYLDKDTLDYDAVVSGTTPVAYSQTVITKLQGNCYAGYVHLGYDITSALKVLGGARFEYQKLRFDSVALTEQQSDFWTNISPKIGVQYQIIPESMLYATISQGYRPGGFNSRATDSKYYSYDPETLWSYEVGVKNTLWDNKLMLNAALFYMDISDKQVEENVNLTTSYLTNGAKATSMGAEVDFIAIVVPGVTLNGGAGYTHAEFDEFSDSTGDYEGNKLPYAPEYTYNIGVQYRADNGLYASTGLVGYGKTYFDKNNTSYRNSYALVNCKVGYETEQYDVYLYGKNIFDTEYDVKNWSGFDLYSEPGEFGLQLVARF